MKKKLSENKAKKIIELYLDGYTQTAISKTLHIDQSTVSKYIGQYKALLEQKGSEVASKVFEVQDKFDEMQTVVAEFNANDLTLADVDIALQIEKLLQKCGIKHEDYKSFVQVCKKTADESYIEAALNLNDLENKFGMSYEEIIKNVTKSLSQLKQSNGELKDIKEEIHEAKSALIEITEQKKTASDDLKQHMQKINVTEEKLKKIESLALALNKAGTSEKDLPSYIEGQKLLNEAGINLSIFVEMLGKVKVATKGDHGEKLLNLLSEYGGLAGVIDEYQNKKQLLTQEVSDLEQKVEMKDKLTGEIKIQKDVKAKLDADVAQLQKSKIELGNVTAKLQTAQAANKNLNEENAKLEKQINGQQAIRDSLENEIIAREEKVSDLSKLESQRETLLHNISELEGLINKEKNAGRYLKDSWDWYRLIQGKNSKSPSRFSQPCLRN